MQTDCAGLSARPKKKVSYYLFPVHGVRKLSWPEHRGREQLAQDC